MNATPELQTQRLVLEPVRPQHAQEAWPHLDDERMWRYFEEQRPATLDALVRLYEKWARGSPRDDEIWLNWLCRERSSAKLVGSVQATVLLSERFSFVAYAVYPEHRRTGYAREATQAIIAHVEERYGITRFRAEMDKRNEASFRLAESMGFVRAAARDGDYVYELKR